MKKKKVKLKPTKKNDEKKIKMWKKLCILLLRKTKRNSHTKKENMEEIDDMDELTENESQHHSRSHQDGDNIVKTMPND